MRMIGVDVGGTFTDIVYCDMSSIGFHFPKDSLAQSRAFIWRAASRIGWSP